MNLRGVVHVLLWCFVRPSSGQEVRCAPVEGRRWLFGAAHKTGTALLWQVVYALWPAKLDVAERPLDRAVTTDEQIIMWTRMFWREPENGQDITAERATEALEKLGDKTRGVLFVRDPLEIILSAYFYHVGTDNPDEDWLLATPIYAAKEIWVPRRKFEELCRGAGLSAGDSASVAACVAAAFIRDSTNDANERYDNTYQDLLRDVDVNLGIMIEAIRSYPDVEDLNKTMHAVNSLSPARKANYHFFDLDAVTASTETFTAAFEGIWRFLGSRNDTDCMSVASRFDTNKRPSGGHFTGHAMPATLAHDRDSLRCVFTQTKFFQKRIEPLRRSLGYGGDEGGRNPYLEYPLTPDDDPLAEDPSVPSHRV